MGRRYNFQLGPGLGLLTIGDSKTLGGTCCEATHGFRDELLATLDPLIENGAEEFGSLAQGGVGVQGINSQVGAFLSSIHGQPDWALVNLGTNDLPAIRSGSMTEATWTAQLGAILDAIHARWATTQVRVMRIYRSDYSAEADTLNDTWIPATLAGRGAFAAVGPDERTFLPGNTTDVTHPSATGYSLTASEWQTVMGY